MKMAREAGRDWQDLRMAGPIEQVPCCRPAVLAYLVAVHQLASDPWGVPSEMPFLETRDFQGSVNNSENDEKFIDFSCRNLSAFLVFKPAGPQVVGVQGLAVGETEKSDCLYPSVRDDMKGQETPRAAT